MTMEQSGRFAYHVKDAPSKDYTKSYNNSASLTAGGPFIMGPHLDMQRCWIGFPVQLNILNSGILKFDSNVIFSTQVE